MLRQLDLTVRALAQVSLPRLDELEVVFVQILENFFEPLLIGREGALVISVLDERCGSLDPLDVTQEYGVTSLWHLARALELMGLEPILLEATLTAVLGWLALALRAGVNGHELLLYVRTLLFSALLFLNDLF